MDEQTKTRAIAKVAKPLGKVLRGTELPGSRYMNLTHLFPKSKLSRYGKLRRKKHRRKDRKRKYKRFTEI